MGPGSREATQVARSRQGSCDRTQMILVLRVNGGLVLVSTLRILCNQNLRRSSPRVVRAALHRGSCVRTQCAKAGMYIDAGSVHVSVVKAARAECHLHRGSERYRVAGIQSEHMKERRHHPHPSLQEVEQRICLCLCYSSAEKAPCSIKDRPCDESWTATAEIADDAEHPPPDRLARCST